ncbi:hypothetical protein COU87_03995 [Candidatus Roizmanbacteria bacterium CG10_big_fil_rev_8_21_14_0_10_39_12]|uniref:N-acetyltransferase domain-containing protein n=1 Tax=Candidatus Roizmanbacteria bacterium CG10_big_fil_rev_8_21_14_0_10_39_12 TaxID=1974852 RepID=A0A2M8KNQ1_9BACT|nr:MAG: hypothetical protein COU87_03995 [Candidatus Roizmanbacteria bacterium CG10_big_fil_rev_8_21_14_0_10_39_12]
MKVRPYESNDLTQIKTIILSLHPQWFDKNALNNIPIDVVLGKTFVVAENVAVQGFIVISSLEGVVWINWLGVDPKRHGQGIGTKLLTHAEDELKKIGVSELRVDTVVEQSPADGTYDKTIQFYLKNNFVIFEKKEQQKHKEFIYKRGILKKDLLK